MNLQQLKNLGYDINFNQYGYLVKFDDVEIVKVCRRYDRVDSSEKLNLENVHKDHAIKEALRHYLNNQAESA